MCKITAKLKERFCKDLNIPIKIFTEPYFMSRLTLYDNYYHCLEKYHHFVDLIEKIGGEEAYFEYYNKIKDAAITYLNENKDMFHFSKEEDMSKYTIKNTGFPKRDIYHTNNDGKYFVSFDMKRGNFTALHHYNPNIVGGKNTYEEFLGMFTNEPHLLESKYVRQVIFGNVNPRRQVTYEHYLMDKVLDDILTYCDKTDVVCFSTDEIVIRVDEDNMKNIMPKVKETVSKSCNDNINIRSELFKLHKIKGLSDGFVKEILDGEGDLVVKCVNTLDLPFVFREIYNLPDNDNDFIFMYEGKFAKLLEKPNIEIPKRDVVSSILDNECLSVPLRNSFSDDTEMIL
jgi:hypothetical protein